MRKVPVSAAVLAATLLVTTAGSAGAADVRGDPGFHASWRPGEVIWARPLADAAAIPSAAVNLRIEYISASAQGRPVPVTGTVAIPPGRPPAGGWPVISWAHGTTGVAGECAPSLDTATGPEHAYLSVVDPTLNAWVARGFAVVQTDYQGLGGPGPAPYLVGRAEANDVVYIAEAARHLDHQLSRKWFAMGHSQGGQAALFTAAVASREAPNLKFMGAAAIAPANGFAILADAVKAANPLAQGALPFLPLIMLGMAAADPAVHPDQLVTPAGEQLLDAARQGCLLTTIDSVAAATPVGDVFSASASLSELDADMAANEPSTLDPSAPLFVAQGLADQTIIPANTANMVTQLCAKGATVDFQTYSGVDHRGSIAASLPDVESWVASLLAGQPPATTC